MVLCVTLNTIPFFLCNRQENIPFYGEQIGQVPGSPEQGKSMDNGKTNNDGQRNMYYNKVYGYAACSQRHSRGEMYEPGKDRQYDLLFLLICGNRPVLVNVRPHPDDGRYVGYFQKVRQNNLLPVKRR